MRPSRLISATAILDARTRSASAVRAAFTAGLLLAVTAVFTATEPVLCQNEQSAELDQRMVRIVERTPLTNDVYQSVIHGLSFLPPEVKRSFTDAGVSVVITPTVEQLGVKGERSEYSPATHRVIISEQNIDGTTLYLKRLHITTLHELGHAFDQLLGYPSRGSKFQELYAAEAPNVPAEYQQRLSYFLQPGQPGPRECFASLFACKYYRGNDERLRELKASFPRSFEYVESLHLLP